MFVMPKGEVGAGSINHEFTSVNLSLLDERERRSENQPMVEKTETFAVRFDRLRGGMSYQALSEAIERKTGVRITPQAMHKWSQGGDIAKENLKIVAEFFGVTEAHLLYGVGPETGTSLEDAVNALPAQARQEVLDFIRYKIERADTRLFTGEQVATYLTMIDRLVVDRTTKK